MIEKLNTKKGWCSLCLSAIFLITALLLVLCFTVMQRKVAAESVTHTLSFEYGIGTADTEKAETFQTTNATATMETKNVVFGNAVKIDFDKQGSSAMILYPVTLGTAYSISFYINSASEAGASINLQCGMFGNWIRDTLVLDGQGWLKYTQTWTAKKDGNLQLSFNSPQDNVSIYIDEIYVYEKITPITVKEGEKIGKLPSLPASNGTNGVWTIDGKTISEDMIWEYNEDKTAISSYSQTYSIDFIFNGESHSVPYKKDETIVLNRDYLENILKNTYGATQQALLTYKVASAGETIEKTAEEECSLTVTDNTQITLNAVGFYTVEGASIRLNEPTGIRFETHINAIDYQTLMAAYDEAITGTYILPYDYLQGKSVREYVTDIANVKGEDYVDVVNNGFQSEANGYCKYYGSLVGIRNENYTRDMLGVGYIKLRKADKEILLLGNNGEKSDCRNVYEVAVAAYEDMSDELTSEDITTLTNYLNRVAILGDDGNGALMIKNEIDGYTAGYTLQRTENENEYLLTAAPNNTINAVFINGVEIPITVGATVTLVYAKMQEAAK